MARTVILGSGGHARSVAYCLTDRTVFVSDDEVMLGDIVHIGVGDLEVRRKLYRKFRSQILNRGIQYMHGVFVGPNCTVGDNVLLNTGCQIDHDCWIGDHCVISPGAILCGGVKLGQACFVGAGAIIVEGVALAAETFVPAGTLVVGQDDFRRPQRVVQNGGMEAELAKGGFEPVGEINREPGEVTFVKPVR